MSMLNPIAKLWLYSEINKQNTEANAEPSETSKKELFA